MRAAVDDMTTRYPWTMSLRRPGASPLLGRTFVAITLAWLLQAPLAWAQPVPTVTADVPAQATLGEDLTFSVTFDNTGSATGFGPFIDLLLPATGADGAATFIDDGITFVSASYLDRPVTTAAVLTFDDSGSAPHPIARQSDGTPVIVTGEPGDQFVVLLLPFGSVTPTQPAATVRVTVALSNLADVDTALHIQTRGGFQFGADPLQNPMVDPSILGPALDVTTTPTLWTLSKTYLGPEGETATGPNYPRQYRVAVDLAAGQTVTNLDLTDLLPGNLQFVSVDATSGPVTAIATPSTTTPGGTLTRRFASVTGTAGAEDAWITFTVYATGIDAASNPVINPATGDDASAVDDVSSIGQWVPIDPRDPAVPVSNDVTPSDHVLALKSIATQKSVAVVDDTGAPGPTPGDTLRFTVEMQVSDFFAFRGLVISDVIGDGMLQDPGFAPTLAIVEHSGGNSVAAPFSPISQSFQFNPATGETTATFLIGIEQLLRGLDNRLLGGCVPPGGTGGPFPSCAIFNGGPTSLTVVYQVIIQDQFVNPPPGSEASVSHGDTLGNDVTASGDLLSTADVTTPTGSSQDDISGTTETLPRGAFTKTIYAINGSTTFPMPPRLGPGDTVTYRLRYGLPSTDVDGLTITDYLPLPILVASEVTGPFSGVVSAVPPPPGTARFGPDDTSFARIGAIPALSTNLAANSVVFTYAAFNDPGNVPTTIDILFTVTTTDAPFADGLILSNLAQSRETTTSGEDLVSDAIEQITLNEPLLTITKGVVATDQPLGVFVPPVVGPVAFNAPGTAGPRFTGTINSDNLAATPIDSDLSGVDASDLVTYAIVIENIGSGPEGAFDVRIHDTLPPLMQIPPGGLNLRVTDGAGNVLPFTDLGGGLFGAGIELVDPGPTQGSLRSFDPSNGLNIAVITYDLITDATTASDRVIENTATLANYAGVEGGPDFTAEDLTDQATVRTQATVLLSKQLVATSQAHTIGANMAIGELITVRLTLAVPQGSTVSMELEDTADPGIALVSLDSITASPSVTASAGTFADILANAVIENVGGGPENAGRRFTLDFGSVTNTDPDPGTVETIVIEYTGVALNVAGNDRGVTRTNHAVIRYVDGSATLVTGNVTIVEPTLQVVKTVTPTVADQGDTVTFTLTVSHAPSSNADAFDVTMADVLPAGLTLVSATFVTGVVPATFDPVALTATWTTLPVPSSSTFRIVATVDNGLPSGMLLTNLVSLAYTGLPGDVTTPQSPFNTFSTERTGDPTDPGGAANDYIAAGSANVQVRRAALTKRLVTTNQAHTSGNAVAIGEILTYEVVVSVPEAVSLGVTMTDRLDPGLAYVGLDSVVVSNPAAVTYTGTLVPTVSPDGTVATVNLGTVTNTDNDNSVTETITFIYRVVVLNRAGVVRGTALNNRVEWTTSGFTVGVSSANVIVVEPSLQVTKTATPAAGDGGDIVVFSVTVANGGVSNADALDVVLTDPLPAGLTLVGSPTAAGGVPPTSLTAVGGVITATWASLPLGSLSTISFSAAIDTAVVPGTVLTNVGTSTWTSLPGVVTTPQSPFAADSVERTGNPADPGGALNNYTTAGQATVTVRANSLAGRVYVDANGDGIFTSGEPPIASVTVTLTGTDHLGNAVALTTTTQPDGTWAFTLLRPGTYTVREVQPVLFADGLDAAGTAGGTVGNDVISDILLPAGTTTDAVGYTFGELPTADLQVVKADDPDPIVAGGTVTYTMVVTNNGPFDAVNVTFADPIPTGTTFVSIAAPGFTCTTPTPGTTGDVACTAATMAVGASSTVTLTVQGDPTLLAGAVITNAAAVGSDTIDLRPDNNHDEEPTTVGAATDADLAIEKVDAVDPVTTGDAITYTLTVRNNGPAPATAVTVEDTLPASLTATTAVPTQGTCSLGPPISCDLGGLASGAVATVAIEATTSAPGVVVNTATVTAAEPDPVIDNNTASEPTTIGNPGSADLAVAKVDAADPVQPDAVVVYQMTATNRGPGIAAVVILTDTVPANTVFEFLSTPAGWSCTTPPVGGTGVFTCTTPTLAVGASATFDLGVRLVPGTPPGTTIVNTVTIGAASPDPDPTNNTDDEETLVVAAGAADVSIVKTDAPDPQAAGAPVSYAFTVTNHGAETATNVTVTDPLPAGTAFLAGSPGCTAAGTVVTCALGTLAPGASTVVGITISTPPVAGTLNNLAVVTAAEPDPVPGNNADPEPTVLVAVADISVVKTGPASATPGATVTFTQLVTNHGPSMAENVVLADPTPPGLTFVSNSGACTTVFPCVLGTIAPGTGVTVSTVFQIPSGYTAPDPIVNTATVTTTTGGDLPGNNISTVMTPLAFSSDIEVLKSASTMTPGLGAQFDYVVTTRNLGPADATNVIVTDTLPPGVTYISHVTSSGTFVPATGVWTIPALVAGAPGATLTITVTADQVGPLPNTAERTGGDQPDPNPANDIATVTPVAIAVTDVAIVKTGPAQVLAGASVVYTLTVTNNGPSIAAGVVVTDPTPANLTFVSNTGACTTAFPCTLGTLAIGEVRTITSTFTVGVVPNGTIVTNTATVSTTSPEIILVNNTSTVETVVDTRADVGLQKIVTPRLARIGESATFVVRATNHGPNPATAVVVTDNLPAGLTFESASPSQGLYNPATGHWTLGTLAVGQSETLALVARVEVAGAITNIAVRTSQNEPDPNRANDAAAAVLNGGPYADIGVSKDGTEQPIEGAPVTFTIVTTNHGPDTAPAVTVDDVLPDAVTFVSATTSQGAYDPATGRWTIGVMVNGASATMTITGTVNRPGPFINVTRVTGVGLFDPNPVNDRDAIVRNSGQAVNLRVTKTALRPIVGIFENAPFLITVTNDGPSPATGVQVGDLLPAGLIYVESRPSQGSYDPASGMWTVGSLAATQTAALVIVAQTRNAGTVLNRATLVHVDQGDLYPDDNTDEALVTTPSTTGGACTDVELRQQFSPVTTPGGRITYNYTAVNRGPAYATDVAIWGFIVPGTRVISMTPSQGGTCAIENGNEAWCRWPGFTLIGEGAARHAEIVLEVDPATPPGTDIWGWYMTSTSSPDCNKMNDMLDNHVYVAGAGPLADLQVQAGVITPTGPVTQYAAAVGAPFDVWIAVTNHGSVPAEGNFVVKLSEDGVLAVDEVTSTAGTFVAVNNPAHWFTDPIAPGTTIYARARVRMLRATAVGLSVLRFGGAPADPDATNDLVDLALDGVGPAPSGGRWIAAGDIDGAAGDEIVTGTVIGERPQVRVFSGDGVDTEIRFWAFEPSYLGGVQVAACDVDADGINEIVVGQANGGSGIRVLRVTAGVLTEIAGFDAFENGFTGGVSLACGDTDGDGRAELVVGAGPGRPADVRTFTVSSQGPVGVASWTAYPAPFAGGVRVAVGPYAGGAAVGRFEVITTPGPGIPVLLRAWQMSGGTALPVGTALVFDPSYTGGATAALGEMNGDGAMDLAVLPDTPAPSVARIFALDTGQLVLDVPAGAAGLVSGVRMATGSVAGTGGAPALFLAGGAGGWPEVQTFVVTPTLPVLRARFFAVELP